MSTPENLPPASLRPARRFHRRTSAALAFVFLALCALFAVAATVSEFTQYNYDHGAPGLTSVGRDLPGMLFIPTNQPAGQKIPLVVYLHGAGDFYATNNPGTLNRQVSSANPNSIVATAKSRKFYVYAPQIFHSTNNWRVEYVDDVMKRVARIVRDYNVDPQKIYVTGLSAGGGGALVAMTEYRDIFAGAVPIAGGVGDSYRVEEFGDKPLWFYHAMDDASVAKVTSSRNRVNDVRQYHGLPEITTWPLDSLPPSDPLYNDGLPYYTNTNASQRATFYSDAFDTRYTEYKTGGHTTATWGRAWGESWLWDWLLSKTANPLPPEEGDTILFDFGQNTFAGFDHFATDSQGRMWNCTRSGDSGTFDISVPFAKVATGGRRTTVTLEPVQAFADIGNGLTTGAPYETDIARDGWATPASGTSVLRLRGLASNAPYKVTIWASNMYKEGNNLRTSRYEINGQMLDLEAYNNLTNNAVFNEVSADSNGVLDIKVYAKPGSGARVAQLNVLEIMALPVPPLEPPDVEGAILNYSFNEDSGIIVNSGSAGSAGDLTLYGSATRTAGGLGASGGSTDRALSNNGTTGSRASAAAAVNGLNGLTAFTITGWMKVSSWASGRIILKQYNNWNSGLSFRLGATGELILSVGRSDGDASGNQTSVGGGYNVGSTDWTFFAVTWDGTGTNAADKVKYYRGSGTSAPVEVSSIARAGSLTTGSSTGVLSLANDGGWAALSGNLDVVRVYGSVLTPEQIALIRARDVYSAPSGLLGLRSSGASSPATAPVLTQAVSRQTHAAAGDFDVALPGVEPRKIGGKCKVVLTFDQPILSGAVSLVGLGSLSGSPVISGRTMTVSLANVVNAQTLMLNVSDVRPQSGGAAGSASVPFKVLVGDVTGDGAVTEADAEKVKGALAPDINVSNAACDVNLSGTLNTTDVLTTKASLGSSAL